MTPEQVAKAHELLEAVKRLERDLHPGGCKMMSRGDACPCVLCVCDEMRGLLKVHESSENRN